MKLRPTRLFLAVLSITGCGPARPREILQAPEGYPAEFNGRRLYHTPQAYIYARNEIAAGEADRWVSEAESYIKSQFKADLPKGVVVVMEPDDPPIASTIEEELAIQRDPAIMRTSPRRLRTADEIRKEMSAQGVQEQPVVRGSTLPLTAERLRNMGLQLPAPAWAVAAPSHELAVICGKEVGIAAARKMAPNLTESQVKKVSEMGKEKLALAFEMPRLEVVFLLWIQSRQDMNDEQRREAMRNYIRRLYRSNWLPAPDDNHLDW
jgi:hypothetical protein